MSTPLELAFSESGEGPPLILLHGLYGSGTNWRGIARHFESDYRVLLPDLRGHGQSPAHPDMDYRRMADDVVALMDRAGLEQARVVGHSMGGKVAMTLALCHPARVERLGVVDIAPIAYDHGAEHGGIIAALQQLDTDHLSSRAEADAALAPAIPSTLVRQFLLTNLQRQGDGWSWRIPLDILADQLPVIQGWPLSTEPQWDGPALFIHGEASGYVDATGRERIRRHFPHAQIKGLPGVGHWVHAEAPTAFIEHLDPFLNPEQPH